jgi:hypothetical protein
MGNVFSKHDRKSNDLKSVGHQAQKFYWVGVGFFLVSQNID